ncbi:NADH-FMN oxidoreductase RutF, flavin reductase (DIM6/NTAB) family [Marisediminitalea aggregata]|uniref:NADH-FMN oxidoreductase RutF, flavin reductase (DIM6/NTAB) family n=1 Tax=Marisediminitalea aggregata TaxID=634436 RepID=A0A1M5EYD1_9ALTE|nr:flavin reductase family protein [Marisediminitalea aggregata]MAP21849.1 flavin reductase family protein [Alteromonadaceae bacterium]SHF84310.1 NADH-FMN oxidoreductase RutF, flavin reductase (DIM6/NTAB) family [Marisediminitalea aggregata]HBY39083.1 flavin reductase family protein [Alteromonas sp.]|tara:strand:- start:41539 stop:42159 length:621 start_codon:yes stop_codon:yes gene_type:complete
MSDRFYSYQVANGHGLPHDPFKAIIAPRPIGWIASKSLNGVANLAPYSFFNAFNNAPPIIGFASVGYKDSVKNIEETGEFCWSMATQPLAEAMNNTSKPVAEDVSEFELAGLEQGVPHQVNVPFVAASPVSMECKLTQIVQLTNTAQQPLDTWVVFGQVVAVHIAHSHLKDGAFQLVEAQPIMRAGGPGDYFSISAENGFFMGRPT